MRARLLKWLPEVKQPSEILSFRGREASRGKSHAENQREWVRNRPIMTIGRAWSQKREATGVGQGQRPDEKPSAHVRSLSRARILHEWPISTAAERSSRQRGEGFRDEGGIFDGAGAGVPCGRGGAAVRAGPGRRQRLRDRPKSACCRCAKPSCRTNTASRANAIESKSVS